MPTRAWRAVRWVATLAVAVSAAGLPSLAQGQGQGQGVRKNSSGAPDRNGNGTTDHSETYCPPQSPFGTKAPTNHPRDANKGGSAATDYFMGEYTFVQGEKDFKVIVWCIASARAEPPFADYFTFEVQTSESGQYTTAVAPNSVPVSDEYPAGLPRAGAT